MQRKQMMLVLVLSSVFQCTFLYLCFFFFNLATCALAPPPLVTNRQKSSLKSLKIKTFGTSEVNQRALPPECQTV